MYPHADTCVRAPYHHRPWRVLRGIVVDLDSVYYSDVYCCSLLVGVDKAIEPMEKKLAVLGSWDDTLTGARREAEKVSWRDSR